MLCQGFLSVTSISPFTLSCVLQGLTCTFKHFCSCFRHHEMFLIGFTTSWVSVCSGLGSLCYCQPSQVGQKGSCLFLLVLLFVPSNIFNSVWTISLQTCISVHRAEMIGFRNKQLEHWISLVQHGWIGSLVVCSFSLNIICFQGFLGLNWGRFRHWWLIYARSIICLTEVCHLLRQIFGLSRLLGLLHCKQGISPTLLHRTCCGKLLILMAELEMRACGFCAVLWREHYQVFFSSYYQTLCYFQYVKLYVLNSISLFY